MYMIAVKAYGEDRGNFFVAMLQPGMFQGAGICCCFLR